MNEDLRPCYDIASDWVPLPTMPKEIMVHQHKDYPDLYRVVDFKTQSVFFNDAKRVTPATIIDINRDIGMERKLALCPFLIKILAAEKPISLPYVHEELKVYIEDLDGAIGVLYYMDSDEEKNLVPIKRFFRWSVGVNDILHYKEITREEFNMFKEAGENVDKA